MIQALKEHQVSKKKTTGVTSQDEMARRKERYMAAEKKMKAMVKKGEISERDAEDKLIGIRKELFGESGGEKDDMARRKERYMAAEKKLKAMVEKGEISEQAAKERLAEYRKKMAQEP